jgi:hypothetical protein
MKTFDVDCVEERRRLMSAAFKRLKREEKVRTRANFWCCSGCACSASQCLDEKLKKAKKPIPLGFVYWHRQDDEGFREDGGLAIRYCTPDGKRTKELGEKIVKVLRDMGVPVKWSGSPDEVIEVWP